jgi:hypothetical protein
MIDKKTLYINIKTLDGHRRVVVACLEKDNDLFCLSYTKGCKQIKSFNGFGSLNITKKHYSEELFPFFKNRLLSKNRPEYTKFIQWMELNNDTHDCFDILTLTEGKRETDTIEIFVCPQKINNNFIVKFFTHGVRHTHSANIEGLELVKNGTKIFLTHDFQNNYDSNAFLIRTDDPIVLLGYLPRYLSTDISTSKNIMGIESKDIFVRLLKVNDQAPLAYRFLCELEAPWLDNFNPCTSEEYQLLDS